jgi:hypothetical protein
MSIGIDTLRQSKERGSLFEVIAFSAPRTSIRRSPPGIQKDDPRLLDTNQRGSIGVFECAFMSAGKSPPRIPAFRSSRCRHSSGTVLRPIWDGNRPARIREQAPPLRWPAFLTAQTASATIKVPVAAMAKKTPAPRVRRARQIPGANRAAVTRAEFNRVIALLNERGQILNSLQKNQDIQFQRLAQLQAELDLIKRAWERLSLPR